MSAARSSASGRVRSFAGIALLDARTPSRMHLDLGNVSRLLERLAHPERRYPAVLVAGTNGKGSVTAFVSAILREAGLKTGSYYSPHLFRPHERIRVDGAEIPSADLDRIVRTVLRRGRGISSTYFECLTAAAAVYFAEQGIEAAVFEVGLGGRLDATNLVDARVTVVTGISRDHREHLGPTEAAILREKLGIARAEIPLVARLERAPLIERARRYCERINAPFHLVRDEAAAHLVRIEAHRMTAILETARRSYGEIETHLIGAPQLANIATAVRATELLSAQLSLGIARREVARGLAAAFIPGRFQVVADAPRIIVDVSHNEESLIAALHTLRCLSPPRRNVLLFGVLAHKELGAFPRAALGAAREIILAPLTYAGGAGARELARRFGNAGESDRGGRARLGTARSMAEGMRAARRALEPCDTLLVLGSHHTVAEAAVSL